jgi:phosphatidylglycerophosphatase A
MRERNDTVPSPPSRWGLAVWLATGFGVGFVPVAPGTFGSAWGLLAAWWLSSTAWWWQVLAIVLLAAAGIPLCSLAVRRLGRGHDPGCIVWDEIASVPITFFLVPCDRPAILVVGFVLHRLFDISKLPPARQLERLPGGLGVMADDWAAGLYSSLVLHLLMWLSPAGLF